jgi:arylsulfatase A-like enzyme
MLCGGTTGCRNRRIAGATSTLPNILLVTIDTLRADHSSAYGYPIDTTPTLRRLAARGVRFERAYSASATTAPSHAALLTGQPPRVLGVLKNGHVLNHRFTTLAEMLSGVGYQAAAFISSRPIGRRYGFAQGFHRFDEPKSIRRVKGGRHVKVRERRAADTAKSLRSWLERRRDTRPLFVWVHLFDPHAPYNAPEPFRGRWPRDTPSHVVRYDQEVRYADKHLASIIDALEGIAGPAGTIVAVTADHGEALGEHGHRGHGVNLHEESIRVPFILAWEGRLDAGETHEAPVGSVDVVPTILALAGAETSAAFSGRNLRAAVDSDAPVVAQRREYASRRDRGTRVLGEMFAIIQGPWKYIRASEEKRFEVYDSVADPGEERNLADETPDRRATLDGQLETWLAAHLPPADIAQPELSEQERRELRALGYVD